MRAVLLTVGQKIARKEKAAECGWLSLGIMEIMQFKVVHCCYGAQLVS